MRLKISARATLLAMSLASALFAPARAAEPVRVVSLNVCADQLLLELAHPDQIVALTHLATDSDASYHYQRAVAYPQTRRTAEEVLALQPTLVIASSYGQDHTIALLRQQGLQVEKMPIAQTLDEVFENIERVGAWLDKERQGKQLVLKLKAQLLQLPEQKRPRPLAAIFDANGYTVGNSSLRGQMLELAGFDNLASNIGIERYGKISLESLLAHKPQVIVDSPYASDTYSRAQALPKHPALRLSKLAPDVIPLRVNSTICAGPWTIKNIETLAKSRVSMQASLP